MVAADTEEKEQHTVTDSQIMCVHVHSAPLTRSTPVNIQCIHTPNDFLHYHIPTYCCMFF